ncbi:MAG: hypothetical protein SFU25_12065 [Candidatus Caenarcaniphilales bacterium]|nr:hypothetical protein [Candidatus Caenarcaniphilales bacterium]
MTNSEERMTLQQAFALWNSCTPLTFARDEAWFRYCDIRDKLAFGSTERWVFKNDLLRPLSVIAPLA